MSEEREISDHDRQQVAQSLESIVRIVLSKELEALRQSIDDVDSRLTERVDSVATGTESRIDQMRDHIVPGFDDLRARLDAADETRERATADLDDRLAQATSSMKDDIHGFAESLEEPRREIGQLKDRLEESREEVEKLRGELNESKQANATLMEAAGKTEDALEVLRQELRGPREQIEILKEAVEEPKRQLQSLKDELQSLTDRLQEVNEQTGNRIEVVKATLEQEIAGGDASLMEQLNGIVGDFNQLQNQMTEQTQTSQHLSGVLNNLASIFTAQGGRQGAVSMSALTGEPAAVPKAQAEAPKGDSTPDPAKTADHDSASREGGNSELENALNRVFPLES